MTEKMTKYELPRNEDGSVNFVVVANQILVGNTYKDTDILKAIDANARAETIEAAAAFSTLRPGTLLPGGLVVVRKGDIVEIEIHQHDWFPGFGAFLSDGKVRERGAATVILNVGAVMASIDGKDMEPSEVPYILAETVMHEVIHVLEDYFKVEFSEEKVEALIEKYRDDALSIPTACPECTCGDVTEAEPGLMLCADCGFTFQYVGSNTK